MLQRKESLYSRWQIHGSPIFDQKNRDRVMDNNLEKRKRGAIILFHEIFCEINYRGGFLGFSFIFGSSVFPAEDFLNLMKFHCLLNLLYYQPKFTPFWWQQWLLITSSTQTSYFFQILIVHYEPLKTRSHLVP